MYLNGIFNTAFTSPAAANAACKKQEEERSSLPLNWGRDTVNFSQEALTAQQMNATDKQEAKSDAEEGGAATAFAEYMKKARGEDPSAGANPQEQLERLKERLKKLTEQKAQIATAEGSPDAVMQGKMEALDAEISQVVSQIAELTAQIAKQKNGGSA